MKKLEMAKLIAQAMFHAKNPLPETNWYVQKMLKRPKLELDYLATQAEMIMQFGRRA